MVYYVYKNSDWGITMNYYKLRYGIAVFTAALCLTGCGKITTEEKELADFSASISAFGFILNDGESEWEPIILKPSFSILSEFTVNATIADEFLVI